MRRDLRACRSVAVPTKVGASGEGAHRLSTQSADLADLAVVQAWQAMSADLAWASPEASIREVGVLMRDTAAGHVPIGAGRNPNGVVSIRDVFAVLLSAVER